MYIFLYVGLNVYYKSNTVSHFTEHHKDFLQNNIAYKLH